MTDRSLPTALSEEDAALLETLTPELARQLYPDHTREPFSITAVYPRLEAEAGASVSRLEAGATAHAAMEPEPPGTAPRHRTTFSLAQIEEFHELYHLIERTLGADRLEVLINGRTLPLTRELWLPLLWTLRK